MECFSLPNFFSPLNKEKMKKEHKVLQKHAFMKELCKQTYNNLLFEFADQLNSIIDKRYVYHVKNASWHSVELYDTKTRKFIHYSIENKFGFLMPHMAAYAIYSLPEEMICELDEIYWTTIDPKDCVSYSMFGNQLASNNPNSVLFQNIQMGIKVFKWKN